MAVRESLPKEYDQVILPYAGTDGEGNPIQGTIPLDYMEQKFPAYMGLNDPLGTFLPITNILINITYRW